MKSIIAASLLLASTAFADTPAPQPSVVTQAPAKTDSINASVFSHGLGSYALGYEHLYNGTHGIIIEGQASYTSSDNANQFSYGGGIGYRWHWSGQQNSGFLGVMLESGVGNGDVTETDNNTSMKYPMGIRYTTLTANIGKRWMIGQDFNVTFRIGAGVGSYSATTDDKSMGAQQAARDIDSLLKVIPIAVDGELSVGYNF